MANDDSQQYYITIPNSNGETIIITPEILPEQLLPLVQKKQFKDEKGDLSNFSSVYKKLLENLTENGSTSMGSVSSLGNLIKVNSNNNSGNKLHTSNSEQSKSHQRAISSATSSVFNSRSSIPTVLLRHTDTNQSSNNLNSNVQNEHALISGSIANNSNNYITTLQISQSNSNLQTLSFSQPQTLLHYSHQNPDSPNTVLIPISLQNSNQFSQQQILVAAAAVASGGYSQIYNNGDGSNALTSNSSSSQHSLNTTSLAKLISNNVTNPLTINLGGVMKLNSSNSDISQDSKSSFSKLNSNMNTTDEFGQRKEIRLLKNREAARECRRKKKEYVKCLENRVSNLEQQNKVLVDEINRMKELYAKKTSSKTPEVEVSYGAESATKEEFYEVAEPGGPAMELASIMEVAGEPGRRSLHQGGGPEVAKLLPVAKRERSISQLSVLLAGKDGSKKAHIKSAYPSIVPDYRLDTSSRSGAHPTNSYDLN